MRYSFAVAAVFALPCAAFALLPGSVGCAPTAEAAVARLLKREAVQQVGGGDGFRVVSVREDSLRKGAWAMVASCAEPAKPMIAVRIGEGASVAAPKGVKIGERVTVIAEGSESRFELVGMARDSGAASEVVRIEMPRLSMDDGEAAPVIRCRVVRAGVVEVVR
jgi:hypothetical protein